MTTESSVTVSLGKILEIERQRIREEQEAERLRQVAEFAQKEAAAIAARAAQEAALQAEEQRRKREAAMQAEADARLRAIQAAAIEGARVEAAQKALILQRVHEQEHERKLAEIAQDTSKQRLKRALMVGVVSAVVLFGGGLGLYFGKLKPEADRAAASKLVEVETARANAKAAEDELAASNRRMAELERQYADAKTELERLEIKRKMDAMNPGRPPVLGTGRVIPPPLQPKPCVQDKDPLNPCLRP